jgi:hypothetical protein
MQSMHITTRVVSLDPAHGEVNSIKENVIKFVRLVAYSAGIPVSCTNKTYCHDITEILLKVALVTLTQKTNN